MLRYLKPIRTNSMEKMTSKDFTLLSILLSLCWAQQSDPGSERPPCDRCDLQLSCDCSHGGFTHVPMVTDLALTLDLSFNNISEVTEDDLTGHSRLKALSLQGNRLAAIHPSAFDSLWSLENLDLSNNQLKALNHTWFRKLGALQQLNLLNNPYRCLGSPSVFQSLSRVRRLRFGGPALEELMKGHLLGVTELEELTMHANNIIRYESGALADIWPLGHVTLSLHGPFLTNAALASAVLADVSYPHTPLVLEDLYWMGNESARPLKETAKKRIRSLTLRNFTASDEAIVSLLNTMTGVPLMVVSLEGMTLTGEGRWEGASSVDLKTIDEIYIRHPVVIDLFQFVEHSSYLFLLQYPSKVSFINAEVFVIPCLTSFLLVNVHYLDLSNNLLTDLTLRETLCHGCSPLKGLRVLNISGNALKSLSTVSHLVEKLSKLTHLDISRNAYSSMPQHCSWPHTLRYLNISRATLSTVTQCLPKTLEVLDLSNNNLKSFLLFLPALRELYLSGNKFLRLPPGWLFPNLQTLTLQSNTLNTFGHSDIRSYERLQSLQAGQNKFDCSCDFVDFLQSVFEGDGDVQLTDKEDIYVCDSPLYLQGEVVSQVSLSLYECHQVLCVSVICGVVLCVSTLACVLLWYLHAIWYLKMTWAWLKAKRSSRRRQKRDQEGTEARLSYDAFVSYSERDASWVENLLVPELERTRESSEDSMNAVSPRPLTLCLHKRDFLPGHWIMDNIMSAIESSRRTIFILSENFVQSDWCRYELDFSHFWLFDGNAGGEAAILILLEPLPKDNIPKRFYKLHKLMSSTTYLEWPQEEEKCEEFWESLHKALRIDD
ncbi:LOW QUALITY PROTEIN: toll-like receptor 2 type-2 [Xyrichtys novacula]|uniref:Toll-like receptor 2 n=1 Tax=Xyrichtys novacula TaxID=13765 RepID=A0AAV1EHR3_XYRNO|nr:LOW QUALITY PROTEIN: toll-like receptor 2 type-2 [Xyrichtys novacula]